MYIVVFIIVFTAHVLIPPPAYVAVFVIACFVFCFLFGVSDYSGS